ncbi:MAG: ArsC family (seleno)protein, partial [Planctomycetota bacterium]
KSTAKAAGGKTVEWSYLRANCKTCEKAEAWLGKSGVAIGPRVDARKETINAQNGLKLARTVDEVRVAKGNAVTKIDMKKGAPGDAELSKLIIGPTGNLRAPSLKHGKTLVVGFNDQLYGEFFQG